MARIPIIGATLILSGSALLAQLPGTLVTGPVSDTGKHTIQKAQIQENEVLKSILNETKSVNEGIQAINTDVRLPALKDQDAANAVIRQTPALLTDPRAAHNNQRTQRNLALMKSDRPEEPIYEALNRDLEEKGKQLAANDELNNHTAQDTQNAKSEIEVTRAHLQAREQLSDLLNQYQDLKNQQRIRRTVEEKDKTQEKTRQQRRRIDELSDAATTRTE